MSDTTQQKIPLLNAILMGINIMVGAGMLTGPAIMAQEAGKLSFAGWVLAGVIFLPIVYAIAKLALLIPVQGGLYAYCKKGFGAWGGYLSGCLYFLCYILAVAGVMSGFQLYVAANFFQDSFFVQRAVFFAIFLGLVAGLNCLRLITISTIQSYLTVFKMLPALCAIAVGVLFFKPTMLQYTLAEVQGVPWTLAFAVFGFLGFEFCCNMTTQIQGGAPAARKAIFYSFFGFVAVAALFHFNVLSIMGVDNLIAFQAAAFPSFIAQAGGLFVWLGKAMGLVVPFATALTYFNSMNGILFLSGTIMHAITSDRKLLGSDFFNTLSNNGRPFYVVLGSALLTWLIATFIPSTASLMYGCSFAFSAILCLSILTLLKADTDRSIFSLGLTSFAALLAAGLTGYNVISCAPDWWSRLIILSPVWLGLIIFAVLYTKPDLEHAVQREPHDLERDVLVREELEKAEENKQSQNNKASGENK